jgi:hypothetical protein
MRGIEKQKLKIELKERELKIRENSSPHIDRHKAKIKELESIIISIPDSDNYYRIEIEHKEIYTWKWIDIRVKQDGSVSPLSNIDGTFTIYDGRIEIFFQSKRPKLGGSGGDMYSPPDPKLIYPEVENPTGIELIIYIANI